MSGLMTAVRYACRLLATVVVWLGGVLTGVSLLRADAGRVWAAGQPDRAINAGVVFLVAVLLVYTLAGLVRDEVEG